MKRFALGIIFSFCFFSACGFTGDISMPESYEGEIKMEANLDYTCEYDVNQDGKNELIGCYSYKESVVKTYLVYDELNGMQEYTFGPGGDNACTTCIIKDENIDETYMALVTRSGLACRVIRLNTPDEHTSVVEVWREFSKNGEIVISCYLNGEETNKQSVLDYYQNLEMVEPENYEFSDESLDYWLK